MSTTTDPAADSGQASRPRWQLIGPGLVVAATGVGAADLVATLIAGASYGYALLWAVVVGCLMKVVLVEGAGRYSLATGRTIFQGWDSLGRWTSAYFGPYVVIWGFVYGAAAMAGTGLALHALFPSLGVGPLQDLEKSLSVLVLLMSISIVTAAALTVPNIPELATDLVPTVPEGSLIKILSVAGGTIILAAFGCWLRKKGSSTPCFMTAIRIENTHVRGHEGGSGSLRGWTRLRPICPIAASTRG